MSKMFVHYNGTVAEFAAAKSGEELLSVKYNKHIVFIKGGENGKGAAIYTHGSYFANINEALSALTYISKIQVGDTAAVAAGPNGVIKFSATSPQMVATLGSDGVQFGLSTDFIAQVNNAAVKTEVDQLIAALEDVDNALAGRLDVIEASLGLTEGNTEGINARLSTAEAEIATLKGEGDGSVKKAVADGIASVVASAPTDFDTLKEVADWIANDTTGAASMQSDIATLKGADTVEGSVAKTVKDAVAAEAAIARAAEKANADAIDAIEADYLKASDKAELQGNINAKVA